MLNARIMALRILRADWFPRRERSRQSSWRRPVLRIATTSSAQDSGLLSALLLEFSRSVRCRLVVHTVESGKALELLEAGAADVALTHAPHLELDALRRGAVATCVPIMTNRYVIVGPTEAVALVSGAISTADALRRIAASGHRFVSRADGSGTHERERELWVASGFPPDGGAFVTHARTGMAAALRLASELHAFALCDRSTFMKFREGLALRIAYEGNGDLLNGYSAVLPSGDVSRVAVEFAEFLHSARGRDVIQGYRSEPDGEPLFLPAVAA